MSPVVDSNGEGSAMGVDESMRNMWMRDCREEIEVPIEGKIRGKIPSWVTGTLIRNGPGKFTYGNDTYRHMFDGSAVLHRFKIENGQAKYQCKFLRSNTFEKNSAANRIVISEFGTHASPDPCHTLFQRFAAMFKAKEPTDNSNVSVYPLADEVYAYGEYPVIHRINPQNLNTLKRVDLTKSFSIIHHTSHPLVEEDGSVYNIGLSFENKTKYCVVYFPKTKKGEKAPDEDVFKDACIVAEIPSRWSFNPGYMHSFGLTESYYVIIEQPFCISVAKFMYQKVLGKPPNSVLQWYENEETLFQVVSRATGEVVRTFAAPGFFYFHTINQYEEDNHVVIDILVYKDGLFVDEMTFETYKRIEDDEEFARRARAYPMRFVLPMGDLTPDVNLVTLKGSQCKAYMSGSKMVRVEGELLYDVVCEMPRYNSPKYTGKKYRYFYASSYQAKGEQPVALIKVDIETKSCKFWRGLNISVNEPIFVPAPNPQSEDDGVVLSSIQYLEETDRVSLLVLDGRTFEELAVVDFNKNSPVPSTFHGWFFNDK